MIIIGISFRTIPSFYHPGIITSMSVKPNIVFSINRNSSTTPRKTRAFCYNWPHRSSILICSIKLTNFVFFPHSYPNISFIVHSNSINTISRTFRNRATSCWAVINVEPNYLTSSPIWNPNITIRVSNHPICFCNCSTKKSCSI